MIKEKLEHEIKENTKINEFGEYFERETLVKKAVQQIDGQTDFTQIKMLANTSEIEDSYKEKVDRKKELLSLNINEKLKEYERLKQELIKIKEMSDILNKKYSDERIIKTKELLIERNTLKELSFEEGLSQLDGENIYNLGSPEWKEFIVAADKYNNSIDEKATNCIFCGQNIEEVTVIDKYWRYLKSTAEKTLNITEDNIEKIKMDFENQDITLIAKGSKLEDWLKENRLSLYSKLILAEKEFTNINSNIVRSLTLLEWDEKIKTYLINTSIFDEVFEMLENKIQQLDAEKVNKELMDIEEFISEFNDKLHLEKLLPKIEIYINTMKWVTLAKKNNITTQKITTFQNRLFSKYVSSKYIEKFDIECKNLNADFSAEIQQRGRKGITLSRLEIKGRKPIDILSEGEQRSIALANFLAETSLNDSNVCLVFDDPVCSLDHKRRVIIAKRLVEEALEKQIMIFTHDITFLMELQNQCAAYEVDCYITTIKKFQKEAGITLKNNIPWEAMTVNKRIKYLRGELQRIKALYESIDSGSIERLDDYKLEAKAWCGLLRETWERTVEEILFNNTIQRFNHAIQTQRLKKAKFTKELSEQIETGMTNCSAWVHDRSGSLGEDFPEPEKLNEYLTSCCEFIKVNNPNK